MTIEARHFRSMLIGTNDVMSHVHAADSLTICKPKSSRTHFVAPGERFTGRQIPSIVDQLGH